MEGKMLYAVWTFWIPLWANKSWNLKSEFFTTNQHLGLALLSLGLLIRCWENDGAMGTLERWETKRSKSLQLEVLYCISLRCAYRPLLSRWSSVVRTTKTQNCLPPPRGIRRNNRNSVSLGWEKITILKMFVFWKPMLETWLCHCTS